MQVGIPAWVQRRLNDALPPAPPEISFCRKTVLFGTPEAPPEYCLEETLPGAEYCAAHSEPGDDPSWDRYREQRNP